LESGFGEVGRVEKALNMRPNIEGDEEAGGEEAVSVEDFSLGLTLEMESFMRGERLETSEGVDLKKEKSSQ
jgi:hypothetical protein